MNKVFLEGNLGDAPRIMRGAKGSIARIRVATNEVIRRPDGTTEKITEWHTVIAFNALADACEGLQKGDSVSLHGRNSTRSFQTRDGHKASETQVIAAWISRPLQRIDAGASHAPQATQPAPRAPVASPAPSPRQAVPAAAEAAVPPPSSSVPLRHVNGSPEGVMAEARATCATQAHTPAAPVDSAQQPRPAAPVARQQAPVEEIPNADDPFADMDQVLLEQLESL